MQIFLIITVLSLAPSIVIMLTSFTRIAIVLSLVRQAIGMPQLPPNQVILGLSLFLTLFIMAPVYTEINQKAIQPYLKKEIDQGQALRNLREPLVGFLSRNIREK
ncbi:MAG: flagellar biosynthetic protein FliP, partial [Desulfatiglandales bacterium]